MKIYCSGIGGIGLSAYAAYQKACGHDVSGSDYVESALLTDLRSQGISVSLNQGGSAVPADADLFVFTLALPEDHPERAKALELGIKQQTYFEALGDLLRESARPDERPFGRGKKVIAVCGTHGKSSTTAMAAKVLIDAGLDPSVILGTKMQELNGRNWRKGKGECFLVEACEYRRSFLNLSPDIILVTNMDGDHFDAFKDMDDYEKAFHEFIAKLPRGGVLITQETEAIVPSLQVPGKHMQENAKLVMALAAHLGISGAEKSLEEYKGCWRRMEIKGDTPEGVLVIDDYGHHPREVRVTLEALRGAYPDRRLVCVFQPHTHDRTLKLYEDFLGAFQAADLVIIPNIYDVRTERDSDEVDIERFVSDIAEKSKVEVQSGGSLDRSGEILQKILKKGDVLVTMGAGDVWKVADTLTASRAPPLDSAQGKHAPVCTSPSVYQIS